MKQLELTVEPLDAIGFTCNYSPADDLNHASYYYSIPVTNGEFIYNIGNDDAIGDGYKWYLKTIHGDGYNYILLNIERVEELYIILSCFRVKYNLIIF
jgi:hypothetical protein